MLKRYTLILCLFTASLSNAQPWLLPEYLPGSPDKESTPDFYEVSRAFGNYVKDQELLNRKNQMVNENTIESGDEIPGYNLFRRWEWFNEQRVYPSGAFPLVENVLKEYQSKKTGADFPVQHGSKPATGNWINLAAPVIPVGSSVGAGRVNCMAFMPGNSATIFIGTACGGVWKSTNGGASWFVLNTDQLPSLSIAGIAIDPVNTNNIYLATGDNFAGIPNFFKTLQGHFSAGVFKSTDGGLTWNPTGLSYVQSQLMYPQQIILDPASPSTLLLVSNTGIWRNTAGGAGAWVNVKAGTFYSIEFNPLNSNVVYATDGLGLWRSNDNGVNWSYKGGGYPNMIATRVSLGVTPADTSFIYLWGPVAGFKKSVNGGNTFVTMTNPDPLVSPYGYYDRAIAVSKTNKLEVHVGGQSTVKTVDGGLSWAASSAYNNPLAANYIHQDVKRLSYSPGSGSQLYAMTDGGIFVTQNDGASWSDISDGLQIGELYRLANNPFNRDTIYYGTQDCASIRWDGTVSTIAQVFGSDGMQPLVDYTNSMNVFVCAPYGNLQKSTDGGNNFVLASPGQCMWIAPYVMNQVNPQTMYIGCTAGVKRSVDGGIFMSWNNVSAGSIDSVIAVAVTAADTNYIYAAKRGKLVRSVNNAAGWTDITAGLPVNACAITYITVSNKDPQKVFVTFSGYSSGDKVFRSADGGATWSNYSGTLANVPVNCIVYENNSADALYIGTDFGVYYRDSGMADWSAFNTGLPNVIVNHLDIFYPAQKLRAATYGRGLWETDLQVTGTLPVELLGFNGYHNELSNTNELTWTTASEINSDFFDVMRSDDRKYFYSIGRLPAAGNSSSYREYHFTDDHRITNTAYYYLRQADLDGKTALSVTISVFAGRGDGLINIYPSPAAEKINFQLPDNIHPARITIYDALGVERLTQENLSGLNACIFVSHLPAGMYDVKIVSGRQIRFGRFIKN